MTGVLETFQGWDQVHGRGERSDPCANRCHAKLTIAVYNYCCARNCYATDAGDERGCVRVWGADADGVGLACNIGGITAGAARVADIDVVIARGEAEPGPGAQSDVVAAGCVVPERKRAVGRVIVAGAVVNERLITSSRVVDAGDVVVKGRKPRASFSLPFVLLKRAW